MGVQEYGWFMDIVRTFFGFLDTLIYGAIKWILFGIFDLANLTANSEVFSGIYSRIYVVLGIFMAFKLSFSFFQYIIDPESMTGKSDKSLSKLLIRVFVMLSALVFLPAVLFGQNGEQGLLSRAQSAFLPSLPKVIFGVSNVGGLSQGDNTTQKFTDSIEQSATDLSVAALRGFFSPPQELDDYCADGTYENTPQIESIEQFSAALHLTCDKKGDLNLYVGPIQISGTRFYKYSYMPFISTVVGVLIGLLLLGITIDIAKRIFKLMILEVVAPIPIMSLIDPKGSKDGAFSKWVKSLTSTFLDIFFKLGLVYIIIVFIHLIVTATTNGELFSNFPKDTGFRGAYLTILLILGLIFFAKEAPKFIKNAMGFKDEGSGSLFSDVKAIGAAAVGTAGIVGSMRTNYKAAKEENEALHPEQPRINRARNIGSALAGGLGGAYVGAKAMTKKDASIGSVMKAQQERNATRAAHSTALGRFSSGAYGVFTGQGLSEKANKTLKGAEDFVKAQSAWKKALEEEAINDGAAIDLGKTASGETIHARYQDLLTAFENKDANGFIRLNGKTYDGNDFGKRFMEDALKAQVADYQAGNYDGMDDPDKYGSRSYSAKKESGQKLYKVYEDVQKASKDVTWPEGQQYNADNNKTFGGSVGHANQIISDQTNSLGNIMRRANDKNKKSG